MSFSESLVRIVAANSNGMLGKASHWERVPLGFVATVQNGFPFASSLFNKKAGLPLLRIRDLGQESTEVFVEGDVDEAYIVAPGDLLVGMDGDFNCALWRGPPAALNQRVCRITPKESFVLRRFLSLVLPSYLNSINASTSSLTVKHLSSKTLLEIPLPLPPLSEQRRIVAVIDEHLSRVDAARAGLRAVLRLLERYKASVLAAASLGALRVDREASSGVAHGESGQDLLDMILRERGCSEARLVSDQRFPEGWAIAELGSIADIGTGATPLRSNLTYWEGGTLPWVTSGQLNDPVVDSAEQFVTERALAETNLTVYPPGTLLLAMYGEGRTRGKCAELRIAATTNQAIAAIQLSKSAVKVRPWLSIALASQYEQLRNAASGGVQPNLNLSMVRAIRVPIPSLAEQEAIVAETSRRLSLAGAIAAIVQMTLARASRLRQSILQHAFEGKLVPQDARDEPAGVLLDRIRASRATPSTKPKKSRRPA